MVSGRDSRNNRPSVRQNALLRGLALGLGALTWGCDHATKDAAGALANTPAVSVMPGVELTYVENHDIAFSLLRRFGVPLSPTILATLSFVAIGALIAFLFAKRHSFSAHLGIALVAAGGLGNLFDRITRGAVVDFIHLHGWPVFNVADIAVVVGVGLLALARAAPRPA